MFFAYIQGKDGTVDPSSIADIHRVIGTTVAIIKIFDALPVRRADFIKRIKAQRAKLLRVLQSCKAFLIGLLISTPAEITPIS